MRNRTIIAMASICFIFFSCEKEPVFKGDYLEFERGSKIEVNYIELAEGSVMVGENEPLDIIEDDENSITLKSTPELEAIVPGQNLIHLGTDVDLNYTLLKRIVRKEKSEGNIIFQTEDLQLHEAFSKYAFDSRAEDLLIKRATVGYEFKAKQSGTTNVFSLKGVLDPDLDIDVDYDDNETYFRTASDLSSGIFPWFEIQVKDFYINLGGNVTFKGQIAAGKVLDKLSPDAFPLFPIGTGLMVYFNPKVEFLYKIKGKVETPTLTTSTGPVSLYFYYDPNVIFGSPVELDVDGSLITTSAITGGWDYDGTGVIDFKAGGEFYLSTLGPRRTHTIKAGGFLYGFYDGEGRRSGTFANLTPGITIDNRIGIGAKAFAALGTVDVSFFPSWLSLGRKIESSDIKFPFITYDYEFSNPICSSFDDATLSVGSSNQVLNIECSDCPSNHYYVYFNDSLINKENPFVYGEENVFAIPLPFDISNILAVADTGSLYCSIETEFTDPGLYEECVDPIEYGADFYCENVIGSQVWLSTNLNYEGENEDLGKWYNNKEEFLNVVYGRLYTWDEIMNGDPGKPEGDTRVIRGICPQGYHIPSKEEFETLIDFLGGKYIAGREMKYPNSGMWPGSQLPAVNTFGARPAGEHYSWLEGTSDPVFGTGDEAYYGNQGEDAFFWTSTVVGNDYPLIVHVDEGELVTPIQLAVDGSTGGSIRNIGYSCRCIKDSQ